MNGGRQNLSASITGGVTAQRFEMKYILTPGRAELVRQAIMPYVGADTKAKWGNRYLLSSVYLDSPRMELYWSSALGEAKRYKLRVRGYSENPDEPVFFEIKGRYNGIVMKKRAVVWRRYMRDILEGRPVPREALVLAHDPTEVENLDLFRTQMAGIGASPRLHVRYEREAFMSLDDDPVRITFDREISCLPAVGDTCVRLNGPGWRGLREPVVILEIKFTDSYPYWVQDLVRCFSLMRDSYAKYVVCVGMLREEGYDLKGGMAYGFAC